MLKYAMECKIEHPDVAAVVFRQSCLFLGSLFFLVPLSYLYIITSRHNHKIISSNLHIMKSLDNDDLRSFDLKILDWALILFSTSLMPVIELVDPSLLLWVLFVVLPALVARMIITWYLKVRS